MGRKQVLALRSRLRALKAARRLGYAQEEQAHFLSIYRLVGEGPRLTWYQIELLAFCRETRLH